MPTPLSKSIRHSQSSPQFRIKSQMIQLDDISENAFKKRLCSSYDFGCISSKEDYDNLKFLNYKYNCNTNIDSSDDESNAESLALSQNSDHNDYDDNADALFNLESSTTTSTTSSDFAQKFKRERRQFDLSGTKYKYDESLESFSESLTTNILLMDNDINDECDLSYNMCGHNTKSLRKEVQQLKEQNKYLLYKNNALKALLVKYKKSKINFSETSLSNLNIFLKENNNMTEEILHDTTNSINTTAPREVLVSDMNSNSIPSSNHLLEPQLPLLFQPSIDSSSSLPLPVHHHHHHHHQRNVSSLSSLNFNFQSYEFQKSSVNEDIELELLQKEVRQFRDKIQQRNRRIFELLQGRSVDSTGSTVLFPYYQEEFHKLPTHSTDEPLSLFTSSTSLPTNSTLSQPPSMIPSTTNTYITTNKNTTNDFDGNRRRAMSEDFIHQKHPSYHPSIMKVSEPTSSITPTPLLLLLSESIDHDDGNDNTAKLVYKNTSKAVATTSDLSISRSSSSKFHKQEGFTLHSNDNNHEHKMTKKPKHTSFQLQAKQSLLNDDFSSELKIDNHHTHELSLGKLSNQKLSSLKVNIDENDDLELHKQIQLQHYKSAVLELQEENKRLKFKLRKFNRYKDITSGFGSRSMNANEGQAITTTIYQDFEKTSATPFMCGVFL